MEMRVLAVSAFQSFLAVCGLQTIMESPPMMEKQRHQTVREEDTLAMWAISRLMIGQSLQGILQYVSHVRT